MIELKRVKNSLRATREAGGVVDLVVPDEAVQFGRSTRAALDRFSPRLRASDYAIDRESGKEIFSELAALGAWDLDIAHSEVEAMAAAFAAIETGRIAAPIPMAALLAEQSAGSPEKRNALHSVGNVRPGQMLLVDHAGWGSCRVVTPTGTTYAAEPVSAGSLTRPTRLLAPSAGFVTLADPEAGDGRSWALHECFSAFSTIGAMQAALDHTREHLLERHQFGKPLSSFQALQHRFADAVRYVAGLRELALYTLVQVRTGAGDRFANALALRLYHLEAIREVFRHAHQASGAIGFCFEFSLPTLTMSVQYRRYAPFTEAQTVALLSQRIDELDSLFGARSKSPVAG